MILQKGKNSIKWVSSKSGDRKLFLLVSDDDQLTHAQILQSTGVGNPPPVAYDAYISAMHNKGKGHGPIEVGRYPTEESAKMAIVQVMLLN